MDTLLYNGDHHLDARGVPVIIDGSREQIQRALIRLQAKKGSFSRDLSLGSELYKLRRSDSEQNNRVAMSYVQEALASMTEVSVTKVAVHLSGVDDLRVEVGLAAEGVQYDLEVSVNP